MKQGILRENRVLKDILLVFSIILGFLFILSFTVIYISDAIKNNNACGCVMPIPYMVLILVFLALFIGCLVFYILVAKHLREKKEIGKNIDFLLNFLDKDERKIVKALIDSKGKMNQSDIDEKTGFHRVKVHRVLLKLIRKGLVVKEGNGKTNKIALCNELMNLFV